MNQNCLVLVLGLALSFLSACKEVRTEDGVIPEKYQASAEKILGQFDGWTRLESTQTALPHPEDEAIYTRLEFDLTEESQLQIKSIGEDLVGRRCNSKVGELFSIFVDDDSRIVAATFLFDSGNCWSEVEGRSLTVEFDHGFERAYPRIQHSTIIHELGNRRIRADYDRRGRLSRIN